MTRDNGGGAAAGLFNGGARNIPSKDNNARYPAAATGVCTSILAFFWRSILDLVWPRWLRNFRHFKRDLRSGERIQKRDQIVFLLRAKSQRLNIRIQILSIVSSAVVMFNHLV